MEGQSTSKKTINYTQLKFAAFIFLTFYIAAFSGLVKPVALQIVLGIIGYAALPLFVVLIDESVRHCSKIGTLLVRNFVIAVVCAFPYRYAFANASNLSDIRSYFSCAFTAFYCIGSLMFYDRMKSKNQRIFAVIFFCAISVVIGSEFSPFLPILVFALHIFFKSQREAAEAKGETQSGASEENGALYSKITFFKYAYCVITFGIVVFAVSLFFLLNSDKASDGAVSGELLRNVCMPGMLLALPFVRLYNGEKGSNGKVLPWVFRIYYLLALTAVVLIKMFLSA